MKFDTRFEEDIISQSLRDTTFLQRAVKTLEAHHFSNRTYAWFWKIVASAWDKHKETPDPKYMVHRINSEFEKPEDKARYIEVLKSLIKKKSTMANIALEELNTYIRMTKLHKGIETAIKAIENDEIDGAFDVVRDVISQDYKARDYTVVNWLEQFQERQDDRIYKREHPEEFCSIPTGITGLDNIIGGLQPTELGLVVATTGRGKSITLTNFAFNAAKRGHQVLYVSLEMPADQVAQRIDSRWSGMEYAKIKSADYTLEDIQRFEKRLEKAREQFNNKLKIVSMSLRKCNINTITDILHDLHSEYDGFDPPLIIIDSCDHMQALTKINDYRLQQASVYTDTKALAMASGKAIWSSTQAGRDYAEKIATAESLSESYDKSRLADLIISINAPQEESRTTKNSNDYSFMGDEFAEEEDSGRTLDIDGQHLELYLAKYRDGESKISLPLDADFKRMLVKSADVVEE